MAVYEFKVTIENERGNTVEEVQALICSDSRAFAELAAIMQVRGEYPYTHGDVLTAKEVL